MRYLILTVLLLTGCKDLDTTVNSKVNVPSPMEYKCDEKQMVLVEKDTLFCSEHTSYFTSYCYASAMDRYCPKKTPPPEGTQK